MSEKTKRGRPAKDSDNDSRKALIQSTLQAVREKPILDIQRQVLAAKAGVTPALISYYFPDKWALIYISVSPIILKYENELRSIVENYDPNIDAIRSLIKLYVRFNIQNDMVLEFYLTSLEKTKRNEEFQRFKDTYNAVLGLIQRVMDTGGIRKTNPVMVQSSLWGLSRYFSQQFETIPNLLSADYSSEVDGLSKIVFDMIIDGAAGRDELGAGGSGAMMRISKDRRSSETLARGQK